MSERIKPDYRVIAVDETHGWADEIVAITGRIAGVYVVNFAEVTHLCSLEGSYWGEFLCNITENYIREPDGYNGDSPIWDMDFAAEHPEDHARSVALEKAWGGRFYGLQYENGGERGSYFNRLDPAKGSPIDMEGAGWDEDTSEMDEEAAEEYRRQRDEAAFDAAREYENNGEDWSDLAPWNK